jgi:hypothetical protein
MNFIFDVDEFSMDSEGPKNSECVCGVESIIQKVTEGDDFVIAHSASEEEEGQPDWYHSCEVHQGKETKGV